MSELYVEMRGRGPDLVLLHGWGLNLRVWDSLARELLKSFRVISIDLPGHGRSPWNPKARTPAEQAWQVHATLASRSDRYSLLGWSLGGQIALDLAAAMPGSVERLVLVATTPRFEASEDWPHGMPPAALEKLAAQLRTNYKRTVSEFLELQVRGSAASERVLAELHGSLFSHGEANPKALVAGLATLKSSDLRSMLSLIQAPALVIAGQYDRVTLPAASRALAEALPDGRYVEFRRAAHAPFLSHTAEFAELVTRFLLGEPVEETSVGPTAASGTTTAAMREALEVDRILTVGDAAVTSAASSTAGPAPEAGPTSAAGQTPQTTHGAGPAPGTQPTSAKPTSAADPTPGAAHKAGRKTRAGPTAAVNKRAGATQTPAGAARKRSRTSSS